MRSLRLPILASALGLLCGCNVIRWKQQRLENQLHGLQMAQSTRTIGDAQIAYWDGGRLGTAHRPVLLIHGFGGSALWTWTPQAADLATDRRVVMPDLLWFGGSQSSGSDFSIDRQVKAIEGLLSALEIKEVDVVGISYGGLVANELASAHPERVGKLVLVDSPGRLYTVDDRTALLKRFETDDFNQVLLPSSGDDVTRLLKLAYAHPPWIPGFALDQTVEAMFKVHREEQARLLDALWAELAEGRVRTGEVRAPTLVIWGREDPLFPLPIGERVAAALKAKLEIIDDAKHFPNAEHPEQFNRAVRAFLDSEGVVAPAPR
jgi:pimeloyl-ACP methyl ester carboxylesterase